MLMAKLSPKTDKANEPRDDIRVPCTRIVTALNKQVCMQGGGGYGWDMGVPTYMRAARAGPACSQATNILAFFSYMKQPKKESTRVEEKSRIEMKWN